MEKKSYYIMMVGKGSNLKDTQYFGKQNPYVTLSIGKSYDEQVTTTVKENGGCYCVWDESIYVEIKRKIDFLLVIVKANKALIGMARIPSSRISSFPNVMDLQLTDQTGKKSGKLTVSVQEFIGDLNEVHAQAHALKSGHIGQTVTPAANHLLSSINRAPVQPQQGVYQQPVTSHPGGFHVHQPHHQPRHVQPVHGFHQPVVSVPPVYQQPVISVQPLPGGFRQPITVNTQQLPIPGGYQQPIVVSPVSNHVHQAASGNTFLPPPSQQGQLSEINITKLWHMFFFNIIYHCSKLSFAPLLGRTD